MALSEKLRDDTTEFQEKIYESDSTLSLSGSVSSISDAESCSSLNQTLPAPASAARPRPKLSAAAIIPVWIVLSSSVIIYNNYLYNSLNFKYPVFLVTWHLTFSVGGGHYLQNWQM